MLIIAVFATYSVAPIVAAQGQLPATIAISPDTASVAPGDTLTLDVVLDMQSSSHAISVVTLLLNFDPSVLHAVSFTPAAPLNELEFTMGETSVGLSAGIGTDTPLALQNSATIATITFEAIGVNGSSTALTWERAEALSLAEGDGLDENVIGSAQDATVCIDSALGPCGSTPSASSLAGLTYVPVAGDVWPQTTGVWLVGEDAVALQIVDGAVRSPAWSRDGSRLAYIRAAGPGESGGDQIEVVNADGSGRTIVVPSRESPRQSREETAYIGFLSVRWSADDTALYYNWTFGIRGGKGLTRHDLKTGVEEDVVGTDVYFGAHFDVAADGTIGALGDPGGPAGELNLYLVTDQGEPQLLLDMTDASSYSNLAWSPDASQIALELDGSLTIIARDGTVLQQPVAGSVDDIAWSPDGSTLAYSAIEATNDGIVPPMIWTVPTTGGTPTEHFPGSYLMWRPGTAPPPEPQVPEPPIGHDVRNAATTAHVWIGVSECSSSTTVEYHILGAADNLSGFPACTGTAPPTTLTITSESGIATDYVTSEGGPLVLGLPVGTYTIAERASGESTAFEIPPLNPDARVPENCVGRAGCVGIVVTMPAAGQSAPTDWQQTTWEGITFSFPPGQVFRPYDGQGVLWEGDGPQPRTAAWLNPDDCPDGGDCPIVGFHLFPSDGLTPVDWVETYGMLPADARDVRSETVAGQPAMTWERGDPASYPGVSVTYVIPVGSELLLVTEAGYQDIIEQIVGSITVAAAAPSVVVVEDSGDDAQIVSESTAATSTRVGDPAVPDAYLGAWDGVGYQANPSGEWPVAITLIGGAPGSVVGITDYPEEGCGGDLILQDVTADAIVLVEDLTYGESGCTDNGTITLSLLPDGTMSFDWTGTRDDGSATSATGTLVRGDPAAAAPPPAVAAPVSDAYLGTWEGIGIETNPPGDWPITITLGGGDPGTVVGSTDYLDNGCGGQLILQEVTAESIVMIESLTYGADACADGGTITLGLLPDGSMSFAWAGVGVAGPSTASGTLTRTDGGAPAIVPDQSADTSTGIAPVVSDGLPPLLPTEAELSLGVAQTGEGTRAADEITQSFPDPAEAAALFATWGWEESAFRTFASTDGHLTIDVSLHRFSSTSGAAEAPPYFAGARMEALELQNAPVAPLGDQSQAITGTTGNGTEVTIYVQWGEVVIRVTAVASIEDPTEEALAVVEAILSG